MTTSTSHLLDDLNAPQREAVTAVDGPVLILAGPGSGKTRVIAHRIAYLVDVEDVAPWRIVAVTFTNKAAKEMRNRVVAHLGEIANDVVLGTFHSICARFLRADGQRIGLDRAFVIYDDNDQMMLMKRVAGELGVDTKRIKERAILSTISRAKSELISSYEYAGTTRDWFTEVVARCYERYQQLLAENSALDFDDIIMRFVQLLRDDEQARHKYSDRFLHVLVDEFQDTNVAQYQLARMLASVHKNICAVGDPDQSIYSWRAADIRNILNFERDFPETKIVLLEQNYRSTQTILDAAHAVISGATQRKQKSLWTDQGSGDPIIAYEGYDETDEAEFVAREIGELTDTHDLRDFAVMYRTNAQSRAVEEALIRAGIRYQLIGATRFYERREVKDVLAYIRLAHNPYDVVSFSRVVNVPGRSIGDRTLEQLDAWAARLGVPLYTSLQILAAQQGLREYADAARMERHPIAARGANSLAGFLDLIDELIGVAAKNNVTTLIDGILERISYRRWLFAEFEEDQAEERWQNVQELRNVASEYDGLAPEHGLASFLEDVALISDQDEMKDEDDGGRVTLITLHSAKGLEFPVVFMTAMEEGILPHIRSFDEPAQMEEERRLCYVGMTRAKERLYLLRAFRRQGYGSSGHNPPSRFLREIPPELVTTKSGMAAAESSASRAALRHSIAQRPPDDRPLITEEQLYSGGERVRHPRFGEGVVVAAAMRSDDQELTVAFKGDVGIKKLLLSIAPLERL